MATNYKLLDLDTKEGRSDIARIIAEEGTVLLENKNNVLPVKREKVALFGRTQIDTIKGGTGSANGTSLYSISILQGFENCGIKYDKILADEYKAWAEKHPIPCYGEWGSGMHSNPEMFLCDEIVKGAKKRGAKKAIYVLGRGAGENEDVALVEGDYYLSNEERQALSMIRKYFDHVIVILNISNIIDMNFLDEYGIEGVIFMQTAGMEGANAVANIVAGKVVPSGHLTATIANNYEDYPTCNTFGQTGGGLLQDYKEDIFVGYRYFETFEDAKNKVRYPFGYGLSYTDFEVSDAKCVCTPRNINIEFTVTNIGTKYAGKYVGQVYYSPVQMGEGDAKLGKPAMELATYVKSKTLKPGKSQKLKASFAVNSMASFDDTGVTRHKNCWVLEAGDYKIFLGDSVRNVQQIGVYTRDKLKVTERCHEIPTALSERLLANGTFEKLKTIPLDPKKGLQVQAEGLCLIKTKLYSSCSGEVGKNLSLMKKGDSVSYTLITGASGRYNINFVCAKGDGRNLCDVADVYLDGVLLSDMNVKLRKGESESYKTIVPMGKFQFTLVSKTDKMPAISDIGFEKENTIASIKPEGDNIVGCEMFCESAYHTFIQNFKDDGTGKPCSCMTRLTYSGKFVTYKLNVEKSGVYDLRFVYANYSGDTTVNDCMAIFVSNVGQSVKNIPLYKTCEKNTETRVLRTSEPVQIALPTGECYLKFVCALEPIPDLNALILTNNANVSEDSIDKNSSVKTKSMTQLEFSGLSEPDVYKELTNVEKKGIQLMDVYENKASMSDFLAQLSNEELAKIVSGSPRNRTPKGYSGTSQRLPERGIPAGQTADGPLGLRLNVPCFAYPACSLLASSWNNEIAEFYGRAIGSESKEMQVDIWLAPGINIHRDPRCGRNFEYFSEDPLIAGRMAANISRGTQEYGVAVTAKHYCANNTEHERLKSNSRVSARALRELYIKNFEICIKEGHPMCIMSSYNHTNNVKVCENRVLIHDIPRDEWGWDGVFMTDWGNDSKHVLELKASHDLRMCAGDEKAVTAALNDGTLTREEVMICAERILNVIMKTNTFLDMVKG